MSEDLHSLDDVIFYHARRMQKLSGTDISLLELKAIAMQGYLKAKKNYDPKFGRLSLTYASQYIRSELITAIKKRRDYSVRHIQVEEYNIEEPEVEVNTTTLDILKVLEKYISKLPSKFRNILYDTYLSDKPKRLLDIAKEEGLSKQRIHQLKDQGLEMLKDLLLQDNVQLSSYEKSILRGESV